MTDRSFFTLLVRIVGVLLIGMGVPAIAATIANYIALEQQMKGMGGGFGPSPFSMTSIYIASGVGPTLQVLLGIYLLAGGGWIIKACTRKLDGYCHRCGFDLRATAGPSCPECNWAIPGRTPDPWEQGNGPARGVEQVGSALDTRQG